MSYIIDRRLNGKNKSAVNRQRFLHRYKAYIKRAVADAIGKRSITDVKNGEKISIPNKDISEPVFHHGHGGKRSVIHPGNKEYIAGDKIARPEKWIGTGGTGNASNSGEGIDDFVFQISQEEFLEFMFEDLELPNLVKKQLLDLDSYKYVRAGICNVGTPSQLNIIRSLRSAHARRIALSGSKQKKIKTLLDELEELKKNDLQPYNEQRIHEIEQQISHLKMRINKLPFIDTFDLKYNLITKQPVPSTKAVMFCLMDVSGSMTQATKNIAKRFFILLYLFLRRNYEKIDVVFIRHHTSAKEVDEEEFFYSRETGGTIVSTALKLMKEIMEDRYPVVDWNIYAAQASDGDNWNDDSPGCCNLLVNNIMPYVQYYSYVEIIIGDHQALWLEYEKVRIKFPDNFSLQQIVDEKDIYPVFRDLFQRREE